MEDFRIDGDGVYAQNLKNLYVFFWRWATWKVWESTEKVDDAGVVCFISTSGYLTGPAFKGMRQYLRRYASDGWIINLTPEGQTPDVSTRVFPGVRQPLAIGLFVHQSDTNLDTPATIRAISVHGKQAAKFARLAALSLEDPEWRLARSNWTAPLTPAATSGWDEYPAADDIFPWTSPGVTPNRTWVYAPTKALLRRRWSELVAESELEVKRAMFKESAAAKLTLAPDPLPGDDTYKFHGPFMKEQGQVPDPVRVGFRAFDRQWLIPDARLLHRPRRPLRETRIPGQVFTVEMHSSSVGPGRTRVQCIYP